MVHFVSNQFFSQCLLLVSIFSCQYTAPEQKQITLASDGNIYYFNHLGVVLDKLSVPRRSIFGFIVSQATVALVCG